MIISPGRGYIFVHIPKTGGTSLALALEAKAQADDILIGDTPKAVKRRHRLKALTPSGRLWKHATLADIDGVVSPDHLAEMFVFTIVRNPWDRALSYYHWLKTQQFEHPAVPLARALSFADFLTHPLIQRSMEASPTASYVTDTTGAERCDLFLRFEDLPAGLARIERRLNLRLPPMPHENRSDRPADYRAAYDDDLAAHVGRICASDIERFGYSF